MQKSPSLEIGLARLSLWNEPRRIRGIVAEYRVHVIAGVSLPWPASLLVAKTRPLGLAPVGLRGVVRQTPFHENPATRSIARDQLEVAALVPPPLEAEVDRR